jgi:hypothetical protein
MDTTTAVVEALERAPGIVVPLVREVRPSVLTRRPAPHLALHDFFHAYRIEELLLKKEWS